jgi:hypothetical protein
MHTALNLPMNSITVLPVRMHGKLFLECEPVLALIKPKLLATFSLKTKQQTSLSVQLLKKTASTSMSLSELAKMAKNQNLIV